MRKSHLCFAAISLFLALFNTDAFAWGDDWYVSAANYGRYYHFKTTKTDSAATRFQYDLYMGDFYTGGWYEVKHVMDTTFQNSTQNELTQRYFGWENKGITVHAGNFYEVYDRGLVLNSFRDDDVSVDLVLDGIKMNWRHKYFDFDALSAVQRSDDIFRPIIRGVRTKFKPLNMFQVGGAYVAFIEVDNNRQNINQLNARFLLDYVDAYVEYARKKYTEVNFADPALNERKTGDATYANVTGFYSYFSAMYEYKNYYDLLYPVIGYLNTPPAVNRQDRLMITEAANVFSRINGEVGHRLNLGFALNDFWGAEFDYSSAKSRTPSTVDNQELFAEIRGNIIGENLFKVNIDLFNFSWQDSFVSAWDDSLNLDYGFGKFKRNEIRPEIEAEFRLDDLRSVEFNAHLIKYFYRKPTLPPVPDSLEFLKNNFADSTDFTEKFLHLAFSWAPNFRLMVGGSISDRDPSPDADNMGFIEFSYIFGNHEITVFNGQQRGGLVCSGGVCSYHPTFEGIRVTLLSRL